MRSPQETPDPPAESVGCRPRGHRLPPVPLPRPTPGTRTVRAAGAPSRVDGGLLDALSIESYRSHLQALTSFATRHSLSAEYRAAAALATDAFSAWGYATSAERVVLRGGETHNVIADKPGSGVDRRLVYIVGHLDSINVQDGVAANAPGADDNASGAAGVLEIARVLATARTEHDLRLVLFGGEEQGLFGSQAHVAELSTEDRHRIAMVVNMDMIGRLNVATPSVLLEGGEVSQPVTDALAACAHQHTDLAVFTSLHPFGSDHVPFINAGLPATLTIEGSDELNTDEHTPRDTLDRVDLSLALAILRMNTAAAALALQAAISANGDGDAAAAASTDVLL